MEGYGPSGAALVKIGEAGSKLVVTVDCGAQAFEAIAEANAAGVEVIVVDHHQCATMLPAALALVNPNRLDEAPDAAIHGNLAAVGVAFLLGAALLRTLRARGFFVDPRRARADRPARSGCARHRRRRRAADRLQPRAGDAGAEGDGAARQHRARGADGRRAADQAADRERHGLCAGAADQRRRARRQVGPRRALADDVGPAGGGGYFAGTQPAQRRTPRDRSGGARRGDDRQHRLRQRAGRDRRRTGLAPRGDRHRRRATEGTAAPPRDRHRGRRGRASARDRAARSAASTSAPQSSRRRKAGCSSRAAAMRWRQD